jgi:hypothetical protein
MSSATQPPATPPFETAEFGTSQNGQGPRPAAMRPRRPLHRNADTAEETTLQGSYGEAVRAPPRPCNGSGSPVADRVRTMAVSSHRASAPPGE